MDASYAAVHRIVNERVLDIEMRGDWAAETGLIDTPAFVARKYRNPMRFPDYRVADLSWIKIRASRFYMLLHFAEFVVASLAGFANGADF